MALSWKLFKIYFGLIEEFKLYKSSIFKIIGYLFDDISLIWFINKYEYFFLYKMI